MCRVIKGEIYIKLNSGDRYGRLVVIERAPDYVTKSGKKYPRYLCQCDCGNKKVIDSRNLYKGLTLSCGCLHKERTSAANSTHRDTDSRLYNVWSAIKRRCYNPTVPEYKRYGARGIDMCQDWKDNYESFMKWAMKNGYDPDAPRGQCTIDRIDNNKGYYPENCRWVSNIVQLNNISTNHNISHNGEEHSIADWSRILGIEYGKLYQRLAKNDFNLEKVLNIA